MESIRNNISFLAKALNYYTRHLAKLFPRNKSKWVFGEIDNFRDNPKYLFYSIQDSNPEINAIWIAKKKGGCNLVKKTRI